MNEGKHKAIAIVLAAVLLMAFGFSGGLVGAYYFAKTTPAPVVEPIAEPPAPSTQPAIHVEPTEDITIAEAIAKKLMPSVVGISTVTTSTYGGGTSIFDLFGFGGMGGLGGGGYSYDSTSVGTGVIVDEAGYILTNSHVVHDGEAKSITVSLYNGDDVEGEVLWNDATLDLAVVKVDAKNLTAAELGDSDTLNIGAYAATIGNPLGLQFERSMTQGIISGLNRTIMAGTEGSTSGTVMEGLIQTDATINAGNSGGPLLNSQGLVIGIASARASSGENMGFAIPINIAKPIVEQLKESGTFERAYLGIGGIGLEEQNQYSSNDLKQNFGTDKGIYINSLSDGGGAKAAGLKAGDIILSIDGIEVGTMNKVNSILIKHRVGDKVNVIYMRDKATKTCEVKLTKQIITLQ